MLLLSRPDRSAEAREGLEGLAIGLAIVIVQSIASMRIRVSVPVGRPVMDGDLFDQAAAGPACAARPTGTAIHEPVRRRLGPDAARRIFRGRQARLRAALQPAGAAARQGGGYRQIRGDLT